MHNKRWLIYKWPAQQAAEKTHFGNQHLQNPKAKDKSSPCHLSEYGQVPLSR